MAKRKSVLMVGVVAAAVAFPSMALAAKIVERIVARVNTEIVTERQFEQEKQKLRTQLAEQFSGSELEQQYQEQSKNLLRDLIDQDLMVQRAKDRDIKVESDVVKRLDEFRKDAHLATQEELQAEVEKQGMVWEDFEDGIRRQLLMQEVIGHEVGSRVVVTREDCRKYYQAHKDQFIFPEGVHLAQILISNENRKPEEAQQRAKEALAEVKAGAKWADLVRKYSDQPKAAEGGDIGFFKAGTLAPALDAAIAKLDEGQTTDLIETKYGFVILKVLEQRKEGMAKFEDVEQRINSYLYNEQMQPALREFLRTLRKESFIYLAPGYVDTGAERPTQAAVAAKVP
jgi:peptidyl-prolyl cis-trans isomerase SurA